MFEMNHGFIFDECSGFRLSLSLIDLRKFRSYKGGSVRDLLRAMRNKVRGNSHMLINNFL